MSNENATSFEVRSLSKSFGKNNVFKNLNLNVKSGEMVCLLGPSGSGKTTLIRAITGALKMDSGEIFVGGRKIPDRSLMYEIGFMPQEDALYGDLSGRSNMEFFAGLYGIPRVQRRERIDELLTLTGLYNDRDKMVEEYSGGMRKRLSLAITLLHRPKYLLLDEPTVGIDPVLRVEIWNQFMRLRDEGCCLIISTHVMDEAEKCQRCVLLYDGRIIYDDLTTSLKEKTKSGSIEELFFNAGEGSK